MKDKFRFFKKLTLVQQLITVLGIVGLLMIFVFMPLVDYNLNAIIDKQMYETLQISQYSIIHNDSYMPYQQAKPTYHIIYDMIDNEFSKNNLPSITYLFDFYNELFGEDLHTMLKNQQDVLQTKKEYRGKVYYYRIVKATPYEYLISIVNSDYSTDLLTSLRNQVIHMQYIFFLILAGVLILWVMTLISPLTKIKNYIDDIKEKKTSSLNIDRYDEIGTVSHALIEMKKELDHQEKIQQEMIHNISHDLKTPIALIQTYGQSVKDDIYPYGDKNSSMDVILENASRLEHKVKSLLYLNRLDYLNHEEQDFKLFPMKELIEKIVSQMDILQPDIALLTELEDCCFYGNEEHWRVAIENIIDNASRYASTSIKIILKENYLEIYNDGESIDDEILPYLFDPYVKGVKGQFGLGLSISYKIASLFGYHMKAMNQQTGVSFIIFQ